MILNMSLKLYTAFVKKDSNNKIENISLVENGFSFGVFFFSLFWLLVHTMWRAALAFILVEIIIIKLVKADILDFLEVFFIQIGLFILIGMNAKNWLGRDLQKNKGYEKIGYFLAQNEEEARLKSMKSWHRNYPGLSFDELSEEIIDPNFYLKSSVKLKSFKKFIKRWPKGKL